MATSLTHKYIPRIEQTEENLFVEEYYSSTDTKIYIDDTEQSEIAYISYSLQEQLKPIYGYSSRTFDDVAIGNRIVTGTFKVSIKNPEAQTPMSTIIERGKTPTLDDYNENQQELMDAIDWITGVNKTDEIESVLQEDDETFEYRAKLMSLGYFLEYDSSTESLKQQIKKFQSDNEDKGLDVNGLLTISTKSLIDELLMAKSTQTISVPKGTKIYMSPMLSSDSTTISKDQDVYVIDNYSYNGWIYVMTKDRTTGYINKEELE